jgi:DNA replication and repair protein RecF
MNSRCRFLQSFLQQATNHYHIIARTEEPVALTYESQLHPSNGKQAAHLILNNLLSENLNRDLALQRTTIGIHRDDLKFQINTNSHLSKFAMPRVSDKKACCFAPEADRV